MNSIQNLVSYNIEHLNQGISLLRDISDSDYVTTDPPIYSSGVGEHLRHVLEHYTCLFDGLSRRRVDYDARQRNRQISSDRHVAISEIEQIINSLKEIDSGIADLTVKMTSSRSGEEESPWSQSTLKRELQYLLAHTIHHYALIALILRIQGVVPHEAFGVAPSTLQYLADGKK